MSYDLAAVAGSASYNTNSKKFGTAAKAGGWTAGTPYGSTAGNPTAAFVSGSNRLNDGTVECFISRASPPSAIEVIFGEPAAFGWVGVDSTGIVVARLGNGNTNYGTVADVMVTLASTQVCDGAQHHIAMVFVANSGCVIYVDGVNIGSSTANPPVFSTNRDTFTVGSLQDLPDPTYNYTFGGTIDEVAVSTIKQYTANFTPPSAPFSATRTGQVALYHFDSSMANAVGAQVTAPASPNIAPNDAGFVYSPYNWQVQSTSATSWNPGAYFRTLFGGSSCILNFNIANNIAPLSQIWYRVDNGPWTQPTVAATISCAIPAATSGDPDAPFHMLEVVFKSMGHLYSAPNRWNTPSQTAITFLGLTLDAGAVLRAPAKATLNIVVFGDSITEGVRTLGESPTSPDTTPDDNDARLAWAFELGRYLGAEIGVVGFGNQGFQVSGAGNVPAFPSAYAFLSQGVPRVFSPTPDLIVLNHGANDINGGVNFTAAATASLNSLLAACPSTPIAAVNPLPPSMANNTSLQAAIAACSAPSRVTYVAATGVFTLAAGADSLALHPSGPNDVGVIAPKIAALVRPLLTSAAPAIRRWYRGIGAR